MLRREDLVALLLDACPVAGAAWRRNRSRPDVEEAGIYDDLAVFARHLAESVVVGDASELPAFFVVLERMVTEGTCEVKKLATIGLIEDLQRMTSGAPAAARMLEWWLGPESRRRWDAVATMWEGNGTLARLVRLRHSAVGADGEIN